MKEVYRHRYINRHKRVTGVAETKLADTMKRGCNYFSAVKRITTATGALNIAEGTEKGELVGENTTGVQWRKGRRTATASHPMFGREPA